MNAMKKQASNIAYMANQFGSTESQCEAISQDDLQHTINHCIDGSNRSRLEKESEAILNCLVRFGGHMKMTYLQMKVEKTNLMAQLNSPEMQCPQVWFLTLSSADLYWPELWACLEPHKYCMYQPKIVNGLAVTIGDVVQME
jgi:hypothetical protein